MEAEVISLVGKYGLDRVLNCLSNLVVSAVNDCDAKIPGSKESRRLRNVYCALDAVTCYVHERKLLCN